MEFDTGGSDIPRDMKASQGISRRWLRPGGAPTAPPCARPQRSRAGAGRSPNGVAERQQPQAANERMRHWGGMGTKPLRRFDARRRETGLDRTGFRWDSRGRAPSHPRRVGMRSHPWTPGFLRLGQARDGASQCCGLFSSYWSSSRSRYSSLAASAAVGAASEWIWRWVAATEVR